MDYMSSHIGFELSKEEAFKEHKASLLQFYRNKKRVVRFADDDEGDNGADENDRAVANNDWRSSDVSVSSTSTSSIGEYHPTFRRQDISSKLASRIWFSKTEIRDSIKRNKMLASFVCSPDSSSIKKALSYRRHKSMDMTVASSTAGTTAAGPKNKNSRSSVAHTMKDEEEIATALFGETCRGLETLICPVFRRVTRERKRDVMTTVLKEQQRQLNACEWSPIQLARVSREASKSAITSANIQGQMDAFEAGTSDLDPSRQLEVASMKNSSVDSPPKTKKPVFTPQTIKTIHDDEGSGTENRSSQVAQESATVTRLLKSKSFVSNNEVQREPLIELDAGADPFRSAKRKSVSMSHVAETYMGFSSGKFNNEFALIPDLHAAKRRGSCLGCSTMDGKQSIQKLAMYGVAA